MGSGQGGRGSGLEQGREWAGCRGQLECKAVFGVHRRLKWAGTTREEFAWGMAVFGSIILGLSTGCAGHDYPY